MEKLSFSGILFVLGLILMGLIGYVMNIVKIFALFDCGLGVEAAFRIVAVFAFPLGAILGWIPSGGC